MTTKLDASTEKLIAVMRLSGKLDALVSLRKWLNAEIALAKIEHDELREGTTDGHIAGDTTETNRGE